MFFSSCDSVIGDSLEFNQANRGSYVFDWENAIALDTIQGNRASSRRTERGSLPAPGHVPPTDLEVKAQGTWGEEALVVRKSKCLGWGELGCTTGRDRERT